LCSMLHHTFIFNTGSYYFENGTKVLNFPLLYFFNVYIDSEINSLGSLE